MGTQFWRTTTLCLAGSTIGAVLLYASTLTETYAPLLLVCAGAAFGIIPATLLLPVETRSMLDAIRSEMGRLSIVADADQAGIRRIFEQRRPVEGVGCPFADEVANCIRKARSGDVIRWMSVSHRDLFGTAPTTALRHAFMDAILRGVHFELLLLDPSSKAASDRARVEEPATYKERGYLATTLWKDIRQSLIALEDPSQTVSAENAKRFSEQIKVGFSASMMAAYVLETPDATFLEVYHEGGDDELREELASEGLSNIACFGGFFPVFMLTSESRAAKIASAHFRAVFQSPSTITLAKACQKRIRFEMKRTGGLHVANSPSGQSAQPQRAPRKRRRRRPPKRRTNGPPSPDAQTGGPGDGAPRNNPRT